jgi:hypothetical protein
MDPQKKYTKYRLYRNHCVQVNVCGKKFYIKDLDIFDKYYDLKNIVIIDNSVLSFAYHLNNGIPIVPYYDSEEDSELSILGYYLLSIYNYDDLREANKIHIRIDYYLEEAKKEMEEEEEEDEEEDNEDNSLNNKNENNIISSVKTDENVNLEYKNTIINEIENTRRYTLTVDKKNNELSSLSLSYIKKKKTATNNIEGLYIFDVWKDIREEMNEKKKKSRFNQ